MKNKGFTIIELVVVMAVFLFIVGTAMGIFVSIIKYEKQISSKQELLNQVSYSLEYMSKAMRMAGKARDNSCIEDGKVFQLEQDISQGDSIKFINHSDYDAKYPDGVCQKFCLSEVASGNPSSGYILKEIRNPEDGNWNCDSKNAINVTSTRLKINSLRFLLNGDGDSYQPRVTILMDVQAFGDSDQPAIKLQTTVSQRDLNQ